VGRSWGKEQFALSSSKCQRFGYILNCCKLNLSLAVPCFSVQVAAGGGLRVCGLRVSVNVPPWPASRWCLFFYLNLPKRSETKEVGPKQLGKTLPRQVCPTLLFRSGPTFGLAAPGRRAAQKQKSNFITNFGKNLAFDHDKE